MWRRFAAGVRHPGRRDTVRMEAQSFPDRASSSSRPHAAELAGNIRPAPRRAIPPRDTLDANWDRRISTGRAAPDRVVDLHGLNLSGAHHRLDRAIEDAVRDSARILLIVTGRPPREGASRLDLPLRGIIRASIGDWLAASRHAAMIAAVRAAHPRHGGSGALYVILRRNR